MIFWRRYPLAIPLCAGALGLAGSGRAAVPVEKLLADAFRGPRVAFSGTQAATLQTDAGAVKGEVRIYASGRGSVRREYVSGGARGVVTLQSGRTTWQRAPGGQWTLLPGASPADPAAAADRVMSNYRVTVEKATRRLGQTVIPIRIAPRHPFNPSRRLWVDPSNGLILTDQFYAPDGRLRSSTQFTSLTLEAQPAALFHSPENAQTGDTEAFGPSSFRAVGSAAEARRLTSRTVPVPKYVPPGYRVEMYGVMNTRRGFLLPAVRYSDGLAAFTIFRHGPMGGNGFGGGGRGLGRGRGRGGGMGRGPGPGGGMGRGPGPGQGPMMRSTRQSAVVFAEGESANYLLVGDLAESELRKVGESLP